MVTYGQQPVPLELAAVDSAETLAWVLRQLRLRLARQRLAAPPTYRQLAAVTGWAHGVIGDYFAGKTLPPTDRFDVLVGLLGATPAERGALATARDRIEELRRARRRVGSPVNNEMRLIDFPPGFATVDTPDAFVAIATRVGWAMLTVVDPENRPWSGLVRPLWEPCPDGLVGWVFVGTSRLKQVRLAQRRFVSLSYWHPAQDAAVAQCAADWADATERGRAWQLALRTPPPAGFDPGAIWPAGVASTDCTVLRLHPYRLMSTSRG